MTMSEIYLVEFKHEIRTLHPVYPLRSEIYLVEFKPLLGDCGCRYGTGVRNLPCGI